MHNSFTNQNPPLWHSNFETPSKHQESAFRNRRRRSGAPTRHRNSVETPTRQQFLINERTRCLRCERLRQGGEEQGDCYMSSSKSRTSRFCIVTEDACLSRRCSFPLSGKKQSDELAKDEVDHTIGSYKGAEWTTKAINAPITLRFAGRERETIPVGDSRGSSTQKEDDDIDEDDGRKCQVHTRRSQFVLRRYPTCHSPPQ